ncbi:hypothetical protein Clacol_009857 [Clathrus columnatus]|uniref:Zinc finger CCHC domain-containing protein 10 n=1 Tax=Clathrus columnatus TaxID=1419009 RepID=A0AAV5AS48_9AGAM|nr:hypothetical protein Clacol_009857 [Clathrus columnatus]
MNTGTSNNPATANTVCQKCLGRGHFIYECKGSRPYLSRPSRTELLEKPNALAKLKKEGRPTVELPEEFKIKTGVANKILEERERHRKKSADSESVLSSKQKRRRSPSLSTSNSSATSSSYSSDSDSESDSNSPSSESGSDSDNSSVSSNIPKGSSPSAPKKRRRLRSQ